MTSRGTFSDILEQKIGDFDPEPPAASAHAWRRPSLGPTVVYFAPRLHGGVALPRRMAGVWGGERSVRPFVRPARQAFARRVLTPAQQNALADLVRHGATLTPDFTQAELRSAFRELARRHHPDRHPECGPMEQTRLSRTFASLADAYRLLIAASSDATALAA